MGDIRVSVVDVSWWPGSDAVNAGLVVFAPSGVVPSFKLEPAESLEGADKKALAVLGRLQAESTGLPELEPVTFVEADDGSITLVYTCVAPPTTALIDSEGLPVEDPALLGWHNFNSQLIVEMAERAVVVARNYWRQELSETTAVFDFLPKYFTTTQVRSIYSSIWRSTQDPGNFHRWLHKQNIGVCAEATSKQDVSAEFDDVVAQSIASTTRLTLAAGRAFATALTARTAMPSLAGAAAFAPVVAVAAGSIFLAMKSQRGPEPQLFTRALAKRTNLQSPFGPRPI